MHPFFGSGQWLSFSMQGPAERRSKQATPVSQGVPDPAILMKVVSERMPFGKYQGMRIAQLPEAYLAWFARKGMPTGQLGMLLEPALVIRSSGLENIKQAEREGR